MRRSIGRAGGKCGDVHGPQSPFMRKATNDRFHPKAVTRFGGSPPILGEPRLRSDGRLTSFLQEARCLAKGIRVASRNLQRGVSINGMVDWVFIGIRH